MLRGDDTNGAVRSILVAVTSIVTLAGTTMTPWPTTSTNGSCGTIMIATADNTFTDTRVVAMTSHVVMQHIGASTEAGVATRVHVVADISGACTAATCVLGATRRSRTTNGAVTTGPLVMLAGADTAHGLAES